MERMDNMDKSMALSAYIGQMQGDINYIYDKWKRENIPYCTSLVQDFWVSRTVAFTASPEALQSLFIAGQNLFGKELLQNIHHDSLQFGSLVIGEERLDLLLQAQRERVSTLKEEVKHNTETRAFETYIDYMQEKIVSYLDQVNKDPSYIQRREQIKIYCKTFLIDRARQREFNLSMELENPLIESFKNCYENFLMPVLVKENSDILKEGLENDTFSNDTEDMQSLKPIL